MIQLKVRPFPPYLLHTLTHPQTILNCIDNSGAALVECITLLKRKRPASVGDRIVIVVQKQRAASSDPRDKSASASVTNKVRRGDIRHAVVVRTKKEWRRKDGSYVKCDDNACVLVNKAGEPIGTRLSGAVAKELREKGWSKILSLAPAHV
jgi:large subunit ribosomal protein L14